MRLVLAAGCFDLLHVGHLRHLQEARAMGTLLVVGVTMDSGVNKGVGRPVIHQDDRLAMICGMSCVYAAGLCADSLEALQRWKPSIYAKGVDYAEKGLLPEEVKFCEENSIEIKFTKAPKESTTNLIERIKCTS